jgi:hypothetical protein
MVARTIQLPTIFAPEKSEATVVIKCQLMPQSYGGDTLLLAQYVS